MSSSMSGIEARLHFAPHDFTILRPGAYVRCAVTGRHIPIARLKYWNHELQEAYADAEAALVRWRQLNEESGE